jgi:hypothetical protein
MRNFLLEPEKDGPIHARNKVIAGQDITILVDLRAPAQTPMNNIKEVLMPADKAVVAYREWLAKFDDKGWRIDWTDLQGASCQGQGLRDPVPGPSHQRQLGP